MSDHREDLPRSSRTVTLVLCVLALYVPAYFPATSFMVRHPQYHRGAAAWRLISIGVRHVMFKAWARLYPAGFTIIDQQAAAHPQDPSGRHAPIKTMSFSRIIGYTVRMISREEAEQYVGGEHPLEVGGGAAT